MRHLVGRPSSSPLYPLSLSLSLSLSPHTPVRPKNPRNPVFRVRPGDRSGPHRKFTGSICQQAWGVSISMARNSACSGKQSYLPPRSPFPSIAPAYIDYGSKPYLVPRGIPKPREGQNHHQRTSSESFLLEDQPSWLDDLLNEPETPVRRGGHRRSSSDSCTYLNMSTIACDIDQFAQEELREGSLAPLYWGSQELDHSKTMPYPSFCTEGNYFGRPQDSGWESGLNTVNYPSSHSASRNMIAPQSPGQSGVIRGSDAATSTGPKQSVQEEPTSQDPKCSSEKREDANSENSQSDADPKRVKQKFAQRSRVRKLQYIAELERNVQALQAEGSEVSAELEFLDQQNLILNLENKALKQRLDSLAQEQFLKHLQQEMLEREIARLQALCHQQQLQQLQQPQPQRAIPTHGRSSSRELDSQFTSLSLQHKPDNPGRDPVTGPVRI